MNESAHVSYRTPIGDAYLLSTVCMLVTSRCVCSDICICAGAQHSAKRARAFYLHNCAANILNAKSGKKPHELSF